MRSRATISFGDGGTLGGPGSVPAEVEAADTEVGPPMCTAAGEMADTEVGTPS